MLPPRSWHTAVLVAAILGTGLAQSACRSFSDSSGSISSISVSLSASSSSAAAADAQYAQDVTSATVAFVESGSAEPEPFLREIGRIAGSHGVNHWEGEPLTYRYIGVGLRRGGIDPAGTERFVDDVFRGDPGARREIAAGYAGALP